MKHIKLIFILLISLLISGCSIKKELRDGRTYLQLSEFNNMHFIDVKLNGKKTRLLVDTGASKSLLDISQSEKYGFDYVLISKEQYIGIGGLTDIHVVYNYKIDDFYMFFLGDDLTELIGYFKQNDMYIVGILGSDFIKDHNVTIDFVKNRMYYKTK